MIKIDMVHEIPAANRNSKGLNKHFQYHSIVGLNLNKYQPRFYIYTAHGNDYLGQKKSSSKSTNIGPKVHFVTTWETIKKN